eukprot:3175281-Pleurochrysis_carterae.AAC.1
MEVGAAAATARSSVAWDLRQHAIHARSPHIRRGDLGGIGVVGVRSRTGVSEEDGMSARLSMRVSILVQLRKASTVGVIRIAEAVHERAHQYLHGPVNIQRRDVRFHVLQKVGVDQLAQMRLRRQLWLAGLREECWPKINTAVLLQGGHPHVIVQRVIRRLHPLRENDEVRIVQSHLTIRIHRPPCSNRLRTHGVKGKLTGHGIGSHRHGYR